MAMRFYNELLTAEQNMEIEREMELTAQQELDATEHEIEEEERTLFNPFKLLDIELGM